MGLEDDGFRVLIWSWILPMYVEHTRGFLNHLLQVMWGGDFTTRINLVSKLSMFFWQGICCVLGLDWAQKNWITKKLDHFYLVPLFWSFLNIITSLYKTQPTSHIYIKTTRIIPSANLKWIPQTSLSWKEFIFYKPSFLGVCQIWCASSIKQPGKNLNSAAHRRALWLVGSPYNTVDMCS